MKPAGYERVAVVWLLIAGPLAAAPFGTAITFQGQVKLAGLPLTDSVDLEFTLWDGAGKGSPPIGGNMVAGPIKLNDIAVVNGLFQVDLDFGAVAFDGHARWLQVAMRSPHDPSDSVPFTALSTRLRLAVTPYSHRAVAGVGPPEGIHVAESGHVGIGFPPDVDGETLQVAGPIVLQDRLRIEPASLQAGADGATAAALPGALVLDAVGPNMISISAENSDLCFGTGDVSRMTIRQNGPILMGVGMSPDFVNGETLVVGSKMVIVGQQEEEEELPMPRIILDAVGPNKISISAENGDLDFGTGDVTRMTIRQNGPILMGVGTTPGFVNGETLVVGRKMVIVGHQQEEEEEFPMPRIILDAIGQNSVIASTDPLFLDAPTVCLGANTDCCTTHSEAGCDDGACQDAVCAVDASCCTSAWHSGCVSIAATECPALCGPRNLDVTGSMAVHKSVGIGTANPVSPLHIANSQPVLVLHDSDSTGAAQSGYVSLRDSGGAERAWVGFGSETDSNLTLMNRATGGAAILGTASTQRLVVTSGGNIGIATSTPGGKMEIVHNSSTFSPHLKLTENQQDYARLTFANTVNPRFWQIRGETRDGTGEFPPTLDFLNFRHQGFGDVMTLHVAGIVGSGDTVTGGQPRVGIGTSNPGFLLSLGPALSHTKIALFESGTSNYGMGVVSGQFSFHLNASGARYAFHDSKELNNEVFTIQGSGRVGVGRPAPSHPLHVGSTTSNGNGAHVTAGGTWTNGSSREWKHDFREIDRQKLLHKLAELPIRQWRYQGEADHIRHIGPVAEEFAAAFGLGHDEQYITTIDADGVALAAIQGLYAIVQQKSAEIVAIGAIKDAEITELKGRLSRLEAVLLSAGAGE